MLITNLDHGRFVFKRLASYGWVALDTETKSKPPFAAKRDALVIGRAAIQVFSACYRGEAYCFPTNHIHPEYPTIQDWMQLGIETRLINHPYRQYIFHNANYDTNVFYYDAGDHIYWPQLWCTLICGWLANPGRDKSLKSRAPHYGRHLQKTSAIDFSNLADLAQYAEEDVIQTDESFQMQKFGYIRRKRLITYANKKVVIQKLPAGHIEVDGEFLGKFERIFWRLQERPYLRAVIRAERVGFPLNCDKVEKIHVKVEQRKKELLKVIYKQAKRKFNIASNPQKVKVLQELGVKLPYVSRKTGKPSLDANAIVKMQMSGTHQIITSMQEYSGLKKLGEYSDPDKGLRYYVNPLDGRIHSTINTCGAVTGRTSAQLPNLTQIPSKKDIFGFKDSFEAPKGCVIICLDHKGLELRIMGILSGEMRMAVVLNDPKRDIHGETAFEFHVDRDPTAKQLNFLLQFAGTAWALAEKLTIEGIPTVPEQAQVYVDRYAQVRPKVIEYREELLRLHQQQGYIQLLTGRKRWLEDVNWKSHRERHKAETTLSNNVVQGSGQDLLKAAIIRCDPDCINPDAAILRTNLEMSRTHRALVSDYARELEKHRRVFRKAGYVSRKKPTFACKMNHALQVHDEGIWFAKESAGEDVAHRISQIMCWKHYFPPLVPYIVKLAVEGGVGYTWKEAKGKTPLIKIEEMATY